MNILVVFNLFSSLLTFLAGGSDPKASVFFESLESKTANGSPVFNKINLITKENQDIWQMQQSHSGYQFHDFDEIEIRVHKQKKPYQASYHQLKSGSEIDYKTSCFRCHSGGPRLIRPNYNSSMAKLSLKDKFLVLKWNLLIKSYGPVLIKENNLIERKIPLVENQFPLNKELNIKSCSKCHSENLFRSPLLKSHQETIKFLIKNKQMPPWPYTLSKKEKNEINQWLYDF